MSPCAPVYLPTVRNLRSAEGTGSWDVPKLQAKLAAFERIRQDQKRDVITAEEARRLKDTVRDMLFNALNKADVSNADFERSNLQ